MDSIVYPEGKVVGLRTLSSVLSLVATTAISYCFAQRAYKVDFFSRRGLSSINVTKWLLLLLFLDSWAFVFLSGVLVNGVGLSLNNTTCSMGILACIIFYCVSKLLTYLFLLEKVYIVWPNKGTRWSSKAYRVGFVALLGFVVVLIVMVIGRIAYIREDRQCVIGLQRGSSLTMLIIDLLVNVLLTGLFLWPLWSSNMLSPNLRRVATRTLIASGAALGISATNITILTIMHGRELGWICLASCSTDVVVNALVLFWLTRPGRASDEPTSHGGIGGLHGPGHRTETSKSGVHQMQRISVAPNHLGSFQGTTTLNGTSRPSTTAIKLKTGSSSNPSDMESGNRSPMKLQFATQSYSEVYDGSQPYQRPNPSADEKKMMTVPLTPTTPITPLSPTAGSNTTVFVSRPPSAFGNQRRHSSGIVYEQRVSTEGEEHRSGFLSRMIMGRRSGATSPSGRSNSSTGSIILSNTFGSLAGRRRAAKTGSKTDDFGVTVTVTTHFEDDRDVAEEVGGNNNKPEPHSSSTSSSDLEPSKKIGSST
ncbi:hypothetical protein FRC15_010985 [Serendipita sp. 397]|nr:hypothetical protein FRC15_010985 [Serendipita sp. 397]